jgi:hypothetical protein
MLLLLALPVQSLLPHSLTKLLVLQRYVLQLAPYALLSMQQLLPPVLLFQKEGEEQLCRAG